ncbi:MAG: hypothetical protein VKJ46_04770 [Leptolyngbyaceae bacterium]|nr:hypothetical protein [Leptolyngbyaceae bacterium]
MDLDQQIQVLIKNAPQDGTTPKIVTAIAPALTLLAQQLKHLQYYILQTLDQSWVLTTLSNRAQPQVEKRVIYAFPTLKDVTAGPQSLKDPQVIALPVPVTHILFQMTAMETIDSTIFFETPGDTVKGTEIRRQELQDLIQTQLKQSLVKQVPPNIA